MERAWQQVEAADTPEVKSQKFDEALEWTMLDKDFDDRTRRTFTGPVYAPMWWGRYDPSWGHTGGLAVGVHSERSQRVRRAQRITRLSFCRVDGFRRAELFQQRDRQPEHLHQRRNQSHQSTSPSLAQQRWRRSKRRRLCVRLCLRRLCLRLCRRRTVIQVQPLPNLQVVHEHPK